MNQTPTRPKSLVLDNSGFTLLEIIAVLVIMSILAVVAVPRYFDLQAQARQRAIETAMAEAISRVNGYFAQQLLAGVLPGDIQYTTENLAGADDPNMGDFHMTAVEVEAEGVTVVRLVVEGRATPVQGLSETRDVPKPGNL